MAEEYDGQYKIRVRWFYLAGNLESQLIQLHKTGEHSWKSDVVYQAYPGKEEAEKRKEKEKDDILYSFESPNEIVWLPKKSQTNIEFLKKKTRHLTFVALFDHQDRLFKNG